MTEITDGQKTITLWGLAVVFLLSALDQTIVSTAMPRIIADLNGLSLYAWVTTAYLLSSTVMVPIWGKLSDLYGPKPVLLGSIGFFLAGSWLSGLSGEFGDLPILGGGMTQLIVFRALQGIGGGGLFTTAFSIIALLFSPKERAKFGGMFGAIFGLSSVLGPLVGGFFTDLGTVHFLGFDIAGWRWVFYLNLPLSALSLFMILAKMPKLSHAAKGKVDFLGAALIVACVVPLLLALTFGGHDYAWDSPMVLGLLGGSAAALIAYVVNERFASDPILPLGLFKHRIFWSCNLAGFFMSMAFISTVAFLPLFMQIGQGARATTSGLSMLPLMVGLMASAMISGRIAARMGRYKAILLGSVAMMFLGVFLLSQLHATSSHVDLALRMLVLGIGLGPSQALFTLALQNAMPRDQLGVVTSSSQFFRQIGSTIGVALFGAFLTSHLNSGLARIMPGVDLSSLRGMTAGAGPTVQIPPFVAEVITKAITDTFALGLIVVVISGVVVALIPSVPLTDQRAEHGEPAAEANAPAAS